ncbi:hypothetical protein [Parenemella sanctibonifatiensis]|uniref:DUF2974 domain-containing protein n=1 Tax=Parenemella sanctibonifatiensis TaxID=2016505 RepID=A0A255EB98_9ACTN|nr:hypothetical protein [Parenemella sanctibonifatiensis]OYN88854.1 hypothetical protein CGZ92_03880 [Parenemella sanctibonifatiensis]
MTGPKVDWVVQAAAVLDEGPTAGPVQSLALEAIDKVLDFGSMVAGGLLPTIFTDWIVDGLMDFKEMLDSLTGDSGQIRDHVDQLRTASDTIGDQIPTITGAGSQAAGCWEGQAATRFQAMITATEDCTGGFQNATLSLANDHSRLGVMVDVAKANVIQKVLQLAEQLPRIALQCIANAGIAFVGGAIQIVSETVVGAISGATEGMIDGWRDGGVWGAVKGAVSGGKEGAAEAAQAALDKAFLDFVSLATAPLSQALRTVHQFVQQSIEPMTSLIGQMAGTGVRMERATSLLTNGSDPGHNADAPAAGSAGDTAQGTDRQDRDRDIVDVNQAIGDPDAELPPGYDRLSQQELDELGITPDMLRDDDTGYEAEIFRGPDGELIVAFAGTSAGAGAQEPDIPEDAIGGATASPQTGNVLALTEQLQKSGQGDNVIYSGHSLGGRLATIAAMDTGNAAITYNAAGVSDATIDYIANKNGTTPEALMNGADGGQMRNYYTGDDPLTAAQERLPASADALPDVPGHQIQLTPDSDRGSEYGGGHFLDRVGEAMDGKG